MTAANEKDLLGLLESLSDGNPKTRMEAADNIGGLGRGAGRIAVLALGETLSKDRYPPVRCAAARALGLIGNKTDAFVPLAMALGDPSESVVAIVSSALDSVCPGWRPKSAFTHGKEANCAVQLLAGRLQTALQTIETAHNLAKDAKFGLIADRTYCINNIIRITSSDFNFMG